MTRDQISDDLNYIKSLAEGGANTPLLGGRIGLMWGVLISATFFLQWTILSRVIDIPEHNIGYLWLAFAILGGAGCAVLSRGIRDKPGINSAANRVESYVWTMFAGMMATLFVGIILNMYFSGGTVQLFDLMVIAGFAGQGLAYGVVAKMSRIKWLHIASLACFAASALCFSVYGSISVYLIAAIATIGTVAIPSLITLKHEPSDVV